MPTTYIDLCNKVLRRLNEVEIAPADFAGVRGVQALVKDATQSAVGRLNQMEFEWPFNASEHTQVLTTGREEYDFPADLKSVDWNSFQLQKDDSLGVSFTALKYIERDEWYKYHRDNDYQAENAGREVPLYVFPAHGEGFGITPSPDKAYSVRFRYFRNFTDLSASDDLSRVPTEFDTILIDGAMYYMYMFKDNPESASLSFQAFERGIKDMQSLYINQYQSVRDTRVNFGGGQRRSRTLTEGSY
jgi:hypothetical protein